jgi:glycerate-2-kinase
MTTPDPARQPREFLRALYDAAVQRALPAHNTARYLPPPPDPNKGRTLVLGAGKAGGAMAQAVDALWPQDAPLSGLVVTRYDHVPPAYKAHPGRIEVVEASHPVPDAAGRARRSASSSWRMGSRRRPGAVPDLAAAARRCCRCRAGPDAGGQAARSTRRC